MGGGKFLTQTREFLTEKENVEPDHQLDTGDGGFEQLHGLLVRLALHAHSVHTQQLVTSLQTSVPNAGTPQWWFEKILKIKR